MANWERKEADTLAEAIDKHRKNNPHLVQENAQLAFIQKAVNEAANTIATTAGDLARHRGHVCSVCRSSRLMDCDVAQGWSENCAFIRANTTQYGAL